MATARAKPGEQTEVRAAALANLLDLNIHTANAWATDAQHDWTTNLAARTNAFHPATVTASRSVGAGAARTSRGFADAG